MGKIGLRSRLFKNQLRELDNLWLIQERQKACAKASQSLAKVVLALHCKRKTLLKGLDLGFNHCPKDSIHALEQSVKRRFGDESGLRQIIG